jgi:hypothetical protein
MQRGVWGHSFIPRPLTRLRLVLSPLSPYQDEDWKSFVARERFLARACSPGSFLNLSRGAVSPRLQAQATSSFLAGGRPDTIAHEAWKMGVLEKRDAMGRDFLYVT